MLLAACSPQQDDAAGETEETASAEAPAIVTETLPQVRQVIPGAALHAPEPGSTLERLPAEAVEPPPPRPVNLGLVVVEEANRLRTRRGLVTLQGTQAVDGAAQCRLDDGRTPNCAILARTAMRRYVGRRAVSCLLSLREDAGEDHVAPCRVGNNDLALWAVGQGWAFAGDEAGPQLRAAQALARSENRGLWATMEER